jgi:oligopeptide/dipeptide ABC transporter ATP-binding protein
MQNTETQPTSPQSNATFGMSTQKDTNPVVLQVNNLSVNFRVYGGQVYAVRDVSFHVRAGECLCIVGESGSGKSVTVQSLMGLSSGQITAGKALLNGKDLIAMGHGERRKLLGKDIAMIFQDPLASLNPTMTIGNQIEEALQLHTTLDANARKNRVIELLELVRIPEPRRRLGQYPHELSGGMRQRVMIAMALSCNPKVLIADEPTTALDVTIQAQILALIQELARRFNMATILITHDLGVVAQMADRVAVMYAGKIVEEGTVDEVFYASKHPYTVGLKRAMPKDTGALDEPLQPIPGTPPDLFAPPPGCAFAARCSAALYICHRKQPPETKSGSARVSCWLQHDNAAQYRASAGVSACVESAQGGTLS